MPDTEEAAEKAANELLAASRVGIDTETRPVFRKGVVHPVALVQLALPEVVYLFRLNIYGLHDGIRELLESPDIQKIGIAQKDDAKELRRDFDCHPEGLVDLNDLCRDYGYQNGGARNLCAMILGKRISKSQQTSNWEAKTLSPAQQRYAATDAWICLEMYEKLLEREK